MEFADIYNANVSAVRDSLSSLFCGEACTPSQKAYASQLKELIKDKLFADKSVYPIVQSMETYKNVEGLQAEEAYKLIGKELWEKTKNGKRFPPYVHQYDSWERLLNQRKSIVVTTGTGSGKTECFMVPLVRDLLDHPLAEGQHQIQAIFLYPLNALMEDQKSRIQDLLCGTDLSFAVYNGNLPERRTEENIEEIETEIALYDRIIPTRAEIHRTPPDILLTNPTMLEYMLLRDKDQTLFAKHSLKWIVVDEAHTFSGAGASELALLLRRVVEAFDVNPGTDLLFAGSSATIGGGTSEDLQKFISDISSVPFNRVEVISGEKAELVPTGDDLVDTCRKILREKDYVSLNDLIPGEGTVEEKLRILDELCSRGMRAKVHYFYRIPNNGIRVQFDNWADRSNGILKLLDRIPEQEDATPALELKRCKHCGEHFAVAEISSENNSYGACSDDNIDIFSIANNSRLGALRVMGVVDKDKQHIPGNKYIDIAGNKYTVNESPVGKWVIAANDIYCCPHCGKSLLIEDSVTNGSDDVSEDDSQDNNGMRVISESDIKSVPFRVSSEFISQVLAPSLLDELSPSSHPEDPHYGQQFISFVDSRQAAAQSTFKQNLSMERAWVYSRVFNELCKRQAHLHQDCEKLSQIRERLKVLDVDSPEYDSLSIEFHTLKKDLSKGFAFLTWEKIFDLLMMDPDSDIICKQFINQESEDEVSDGEINPVVKEHYIFSVMLEQLSKYPPYDATSESMGLLESYYPALDVVVAPDSFKHLNSVSSNPIPEERIDLEWKNLLKVYLDRVARSNETLFMRLDDHPDSDIFNCGRRFGLKKPSRRTARKPIVKEAEGRLPIIHILLAKMLGADASSMRETIRQNKALLNNVIDDLWEVLMKNGLLEYSTHIKSRGKILQIGSTRSSDWVEDKDTDSDVSRLDPAVLDPERRQLRLNIKNLAFRLPTHVNICPIMDGQRVHYRPVYNLFNGFSPYYKGDDAISPEKTELWTTMFPFIDGVNSETGERVTQKEIYEWLKDNRRVLFDYGLMGEGGLFNSSLLNILSFPKVFIQAEHTAQVDRRLSKISQQLFKDHKINIMACSTTMEMGVDLGDLDLVVMSSIPPHPSNYRQRAGRSGRNNGNKSACITLCSSDVVGLRTLYHPLENLINRQMSTPWVDWDCPAIIQRHANAFLMRRSGLFFSAPGTRSNLSLEIIDCFSSLEFATKQVPTKRGTIVTRPDYWHVKNKYSGHEVYPNSALPLGDKENTIYDSFRRWLINTANPDSLGFLLRNTSLAEKESAVLNNCILQWEEKYNELLEELRQIGEDYERAYEEVKSTTPAKARPDMELQTPYGNKLRWDYYHLLRQKLIEYLATHRFTPNANMPVDVVEFNVCSTKRDPSSFFNQRADNPSYQLRQALSQYAPGNCIVRENRVMTVAGVDYKGKNKDKDPLLSFCWDGMDVVLGTYKNRIKTPQIWPISGKEDLLLVQAKSFIPDINQQDSRIINETPTTRVSAQLIGAERWSISSNYFHHAALRSSSKSGNAKILYYNEGIGFGYCLCGRCGKMALESGPGYSYQYIPHEMTFRSMPFDGSTDYGHNAIDRKEDNGHPRWCRPYRGKYFRNVILGDLIQTDYCEIMIREQPSGWINSHQEHYNSLLVTLGLLFCRVFTDFIGKDRQSVDFILMPTGHLCIYDTNPGGSGYSDKLADPHTFLTIVKESLAFLNTIDSKDELLDKFTLRYLNNVDIERAKHWLEEELSTWTNLPITIMLTGISAEWTTFAGIVNAIKDSSSITLFVDDNWGNWRFQVFDQSDDQENTWKTRLEFVRREAARYQCSVDVVALRNNNQNIPAILYDEMLEVKGWLSGHFGIDTNRLPDGLIPLAVVDNKLFFTDDLGSAQVNGDWARGNVFITDYLPSFHINPIDLDLRHRPGTHAEFKLPLDEAFLIEEIVTDLVHIQSDCLYGVVAAFSKINNVDLDGFVQQFANIPDRLEITYQDEHLKSGNGILVVYQFICKILKRAKKEHNFSLRFLNEEYYDYSQRSTTSFPAYGLRDHDLRNDLLDRFADDLYILLGAEKAKCPYVNETLPFNGLTHWRVLTLKCGRYQISVYPNGGFINEWAFDSSRSVKRYNTNSELSLEEPLALFRKKEIKYEVIVDSQ